ncbi:calcium/sodium antiporter [Aureispira anguillae]|nr:calcium/sodium antiporter [Aureispira anguillae]
MELALAFGLLIFGFIILIKGADFLVDGASAVAKKFNISDMIIGLTIVSFGTSAPELVVNIGAAWEGKNAMIIGNVLGSNIFNTCLILGTAGLIYPLAVQRATVRKELPFSIFIILLMFFLANDNLFLGGKDYISHIDGGIFLLFFLGFLYYVYASAKNVGDSEEVEVIQAMPLPKSLLLIVSGMIGLVFGGDLVLTNSVKFAEYFGMEERVIGLTVIAIGTSLPELATSVVAALKKNSDIAMGNVVGSNIFNILLVLGVSSTISPKLIEYNTAANFDIGFLLASTMLLTAFLFIGTRVKPTTGGSLTYTIDRWQSAILLMAVVGYIIYLLVS